MQALGSSPASRPPRRASHPAGPFPRCFHPQDPRVLGPRGRSVLLPDPSRVWTSHPCACPGGRKFRHSPRETHGGGPIPSEAQDSSIHGMKESMADQDSSRRCRGDRGSWRSLNACPLGSHPLNKDCKYLWKCGSCRAGETQVGPVWRRGVSKLQSTGQVFSELEIWTTQNLPHQMEGLVAILVEAVLVWAGKESPGTAFQKAVG